MSAYYWTVTRRSSRCHRWEPQDGWSTREAAERGAAFYRADRHQPAVVVYGDPDQPEAFRAALMDVLRGLR